MTLGNLGSGGYNILIRFLHWSNSPTVFDPFDPPDIPAAPFRTSEPAPKNFVMWKIHHATRKLKSGRAAGTDRITAEMIKISLNTCMEV